MQNNDLYLAPWSKDPIHGPFLWENATIGLIVELSIIILSLLVFMRYVKTDNKDMKNVIYPLIFLVIFGLAYYIPSFTGGMGFESTAIISFTFILILLLFPYLLIKLYKED